VCVARTYLACGMSGEASRAPFERRYSTTSSWPCSVASTSGVPPKRSRILTSALPCSTRNLTASSLPSDAARCSGVLADEDEAEVAASAHGSRLAAPRGTYR